MNLSLDSDPSFLNNLRKLHVYEPDMFSIFINDREVKLPLFEAISKSSKITKILSQDNTIRSLRIDQKFRSNNTQDKIIDVLTSNKQETKGKIEKEEEIFDFAEFGFSFGNNIFNESLISYKQKLESEEINENNAISRLEIKDFLSSYGNKESTDQEIEYISNNFNLFCDKENFIKWCKIDRNEDRVEQIVSNKNIRIENEDDLLSFIVNINKDGNRFVGLFSYVHLEYCGTESCKQLIEMAKEQDILQSRNYRDSILECISKKLLCKPEKDYESKIETLNKEIKKLTVAVNGTKMDICEAVEKGKLAIVQCLVEYCHADVETKDIHDCTPINIASSKGHLEVVKYLYEQCHADVETKDDWGMTPINNASISGHLEVVKYLYEVCHVDVETKNNSGYTPLYSASFNSYLEVVKYLYETCHADVNAKDNYGRTPINHASCCNHLEVVKYLYETCHANIEIKDNDGRTPIDNASINAENAYYEDGFWEIEDYLSSIPRH